MILHPSEAKLEQMLTIKSEQKKRGAKKRKHFSMLPMLSIVRMVLTFISHSPRSHTICSVRLDECVLGFQRKRETNDKTSHCVRGCIVVPGGHEKKTPTFPMMKCRNSKFRRNISQCGGECVCMCWRSASRYIDWKRSQWFSASAKKNLQFIHIIFRLVNHTTHTHWLAQTATDHRRHFATTMNFIILLLPNNGRARWQRHFHFTLSHSLSHSSQSNIEKNGYSDDLFILSIWIGNEYARREKKLWFCGIHSTCVRAKSFFLHPEFSINIVNIYIWCAWCVWNERNSPIWRNGWPACKWASHTDIYIVCNSYCYYHCSCSNAVLHNVFCVCVDGFAVFRHCHFSIPFYAVARAWRLTFLQRRLDEIFINSLQKCNAIKLNWIFVSMTIWENKLFGFVTEREGENGKILIGFRQWFSVFAVSRPNQMRRRGDSTISMQNWKSRSSRIGAIDSFHNIASHISL